LNYSKLIIIILSKKTNVLKSENLTIVTTIFPDKLGGVAILMKNLIDYFPKDSFSFFVALTNLKEAKYSSTKDSFQTIPHCNFFFSKYENRYTVYKRLIKKIPFNTKIIIANDWLELEAIAGMKLNTKLIFILHGDYEYYYDLAVKYSGIIDKFIAVSEFIKNELIKKIPERLDDIVYLKNIIANPVCKVRYNINNSQKALFVGRLTHEKGYFDLEKIDVNLKKQGFTINWTIIGNKIYEDSKYKWLNNNNVNYLGTLNNKDTLNEYHKHDLFILPTRAEGLGMVIIEAMKAGCVPIVSKLQAGIPEFVKEDTGYMIDIDDIKAYTNTIIHLFHSKQNLKKLSIAAKEKAKEMFNPKKDAMEYARLFSLLNKEQGTKYQFPKINLSRLDNRFFPNFFVEFIRKLYKQYKF